MKNRDVYEKITDRMIDALENDLVPWQPDHLVTSATMPVNGFSDYEYRGVNVLVTMLTAMLEGFDYNVWLTYKQVKKLGGYVSKGSTGVPIVFWKSITKRDDNDPDAEPETYWVCRWYTVFNIDQIEFPDGTPERLEKYFETPEPLIDPEQIETILEPDLKVTQSPQQRFGAYSLALDEIRMPPAEYFKSSASWFSTLCHECAHATGHPDRLSRDMARINEKYAKEELIDEICTDETLDLGDRKNATQQISEKNR